MAATPLSISAFRDRYGQIVAAESGFPATPVGEASLRAKWPDGTDLTINVDNAYAQYLRTPSDIDTIVRRFWATLRDSRAANATIDQLVVIVRPSNYLSASFAPGASMENIPPSRPMAGDLAYFLAVDSPTTIRTASTDDLKRWKLNSGEAWTRATANIDARMGQLTIIKLIDDNGATGIGAASGLGLSLLATPALCGPEKPNGIRGQVVLVYDKDSFLFGSPDDKSSMTRFWRDTKAAIANQSSISRTPLTCRKGKWVAIPIP